MKRLTAVFLVLLVISSSFVITAVEAVNANPFVLVKGAAASIEDGYLNDLPENITIEYIKAQFKGAVTVSGTGTGDTVTADNQTLVIIIRGDISGDGKVDTKDYLFAKRAFLGTYSLSAVQLKAACLEGTPLPTSKDYLMIKRHYLGTYNLHPIKEPEKTSLKILTIGNSFSSDGMAYVYQIAKNLKVDEVVLGNLYIAGCSLNTHANNAKYNIAAYEYYRNTTGTWTSTKNTKMKDAILQEEWDFIVMQQVSGSSGRPDTYEPHLTNLIEYVKTNATNPDVKLVWHMTWAYQANSTHADFPHYSSDQFIMYNAITSTVLSTVLPHTDISVIIPSGTAIQNTRSTIIGDILTSDGYHLSVPLGRYIAGLTWVAALTDLDISEITYSPSGVNQTYIPLIIEAVQNAIETPFHVTGSPV